MPLGISRFAALTLFVASGCSAAFGDDPSPRNAGDRASGDWSGLRGDLYRHGLALDVSFKLDALRVAKGGLHQGGRPIGHFDLGAKGDLEKLAGWAGATGFVNYIYDGGGKTNTDYLGSLHGASNIEVPVSTARFYQAWIEQSFSGGDAAVLAGLYPIDSEFQAVESAAMFVQPPYGAAPDVALTRGPSIFNNPAFGVRAKWAAEPGPYAMAAVLDGIPGDPDHPKGTHIRFRAGDGTMHIAEIGYRSPVAPGIPAAATGEFFGKYALGHWRYSAKVNDLVDMNPSGVPELRRSSGWYALAERMLWRWKAGNLAGFIRFGATDGDSTAIDHYYNVGVRVRGLLPGRPEDACGLAHTRGNIGDKFRIRQAAAGIDATAAESATEVTCRIQANNWLAVQPVLQWYRNPGADRAVPDAKVIGVRLVLSL
ncbi:MAG: hypothetical protein A3G25_16635 [Betaproteobacteria bacterium RIFCSPLOWO2_12_FULL_63_13]|nr:MAG: hypothetical protein A3H32_11885 [Betaproteobacteria bacterium RIFCSPLOWO2_02_FULL_63_19]OGA50315.1 MAG: hypothetical protein A3G25_16635 [Betaproteobacteria bacterium RIFCSPLOWO2_12_FULL_63_13]